MRVETAMLNSWMERWKNEEMNKTEGGVNFSWKPEILGLFIEIFHVHISRQIS